MPVTDPVSGELRGTLRALKLGQMLTTLPERLTLAQQKMPHADFLQLVLADEVTRRETKSALATRPRRRPGPGHAARHLGPDSSSPL